MDESAVQVQISANVSGLLAGLKEASGATAAAATEMRDEMMQVGKGAEEATSPLARFTDGIKEYRHHMKTEGRYAKFLASDIASMGLSSKGAAMEVTGLVSAFAFGGGLGVAVEIVKMAVKAFTELGEEEKKAKEEMKKFASESSESVKKLHEEIETTLLSMEGATKAQMTAHKEIAPLEKQALEMKEKISLAERTLAYAREQAATSQYEAYGVGQIADEEEIKRMKEKLEIVEKTIAGKKKEIGPLAKAEDNEEAKKAAEDSEKIEEQHKIRMLQIKASLLDGEAKLRADFAVKEEQLRDQELSDQQFAAQLAGERLQLDKQITDLRNKNRDADLKAHQRYLNELSKAEYEAGQAVTKFLAEQDAARLKDYERHQKEMEKQIKQSLTFAKPLGEAFGSAFAGIIDGTKSVGKAFADMARAGIKAIIDMAIKSVEANAVNAASGAASSQAGIPGIGPFLAIAAMGAMEAAVLGLLGSIPSASGGFDIPSGMNPVTQLHQNEMVLPAQYADVIRGLAADGGGGQGGGDTHVHIHGAIDGVSVQRVVESAAFRNAMREARRNGLAP